MMRAAMALAMAALYLTAGVAGSALLGGCAVVTVASTVVGAGVSVASTAVDATVAVGKGVVHVGEAVVGN